MGQMVDDVRLAVNCAVPVSFFGRTGGIIPTPLRFWQRFISSQEVISNGCYI